MPSREQFESNDEYNKYFRDYRAKNRKKMRKYNREYNSKYRKIHGYYWETKWSNDNPEKVKARQLAHEALRLGFIVRKSCRKCKTSENLVMHHPDYTKPIDVVFLCKACHKAEHARLNAK